MWEWIRDFFVHKLDAGGATRGPALAVVTILALWVVYRLTRRLLTRYMRSRAQKEENVDNFLLIYRYVWMAIGIVFVLISFSGSISSLGISAAFVGMILGWSLQAPVTGIAAWLMIILKRPFRIGDRVIIAGIIGDVTDINLTHIVLNQVGGTVTGEEKSGRGVLVPNAILFQQVIYNYTLEANVILDEVPVRLTFDSDFDLAERICLDTARAVTAETIRETGFEPNIRCEFFESGVLIRVRYQTIPGDRQRNSSEITRRILREFKANYDKVQFCFPHSVVRYRSIGEDDSSPPPTVRATP